MINTNLYYYENQRIKREKELEKAIKEKNYSKIQKIAEEDEALLFNIY